MDCMRCINMQFCESYGYGRLLYECGKRDKVVSDGVIMWVIIVGMKRVVVCLGCLSVRNLSCVW